MKYFIIRGLGAGKIITKITYHPMCTLIAQNYTFIPQIDTLIGKVVIEEEFHHSNFFVFLSQYS
jgi:hypothetical protein